MTASNGVVVKLSFYKLFGHSLDENQLWSLVLQAINAVCKEVSECGDHFKSFCADDLHITCGGRVELDPQRNCDKPSALIPSEFDSTDSQPAQLDLSKLYLFYLGCCLSELLIATCSTVASDSSLILHSVINMMKLEDARRRIDLASCKQIVENQVKLRCLCPEKILQLFLASASARHLSSEASQTKLIAYALADNEEQCETSKTINAQQSLLNYHVELVLPMEVREKVVAQAFASLESRLIAATVDDAYLSEMAELYPPIFEEASPSSLRSSASSDAILELPEDEESALSTCVSSGLTTPSIFDSQLYYNDEKLSLGRLCSKRQFDRLASSLSFRRPRISRPVRSYSEPLVVRCAPSLASGRSSRNSSLLCHDLVQSALVKSSPCSGSSGNFSLDNPTPFQEPASPIPAVRRKKLVAKLSAPPNPAPGNEEPEALATFVRNSYRAIRNSRKASASERSRRRHKASGRRVWSTPMADNSCPFEVTKRPGDSGPSGQKMAVFSSRDRLPSIRLKAPSTGEQRKLFGKVRDGNVLVILLNGQRVDVACKTNVTALDIFEVVSSHANLVERHFFGLTYLKDGEYFFLEAEQKIRSFAPPGWRRRHVNDKARVVYCLYLRLKFYPVILDFVKTETTMLHIYLQLRRDVMDGQLQCEQETAYQLAALALQAEKGDRPAQEIYFEPDAYLPPSCVENVNLDNVRAKLAQMHYRHKGKGCHETQLEYVAMCQELREYGIHFYRLYRTKPSEMLTLSPLGDPDTGTLLWIGIMVRGLVIFEEKNGLRIPLSHHPWHLTQTLQFDHKKFYIVTRKNDQLEKLTFYTDSYRKSSYFVNFAAAQHRFCLKMRCWTNTLQRRAVAAGGSEQGLAVSRNGSMVHRERPVDVQPVSSATLPRPAVPKRHKAKCSADVDDIPEISFLSSSAVVSGNVENTFTSNVNDKASFVDTDYDIVTTVLVKDPRYGLGLTLVDGEIQGIKGIYIRSLTVGGPAELDGKLKIGDKVVVINNQNLDGRTRLDAVNMVADSDASVAIKVLRLRCLYSSEESLVDQPNAVGTDRPWSMDLSLNPLDLSQPDQVDCSTPMKDVTPCDAFYNYSDDSDQSSSSEDKKPREINGYLNPISPNIQSPSLERSYGKSDHLTGDKDWTDSIGYDSKWNDSEVDLVEVVLEKTQSGSLGIQVAGGKGRKGVYIKRIVGEPAMSCSNIQPGDRLAMVNGQSTESLTHAQAVALLRAAESPVVLKLWRSAAAQEYNVNGDVEEEERRNVTKVVVVLEKSESQPLGLSLGKPVFGSGGIYIRSIAAGSVAAVDGRLQVGDRLCKINEDNVNDLRHDEVLQKLKAAVGDVRLVVER